MCRHTFGHFWALVTKKPLPFIPTKSRLFWRLKTRRKILSYILADYDPSDNFWMCSLASMFPKHHVVNLPKLLSGALGLPCFNMIIFLLSQCHVYPTSVFYLIVYHSITSQATIPYMKGEVHYHYIRYMVT